MRFIIIASPRTGSSNLANVLGGHPDILCNGNIFHPRNAWVFWPGVSMRERTDLLALRNADPRGFLDKIFTTDFGRPHVGFKIFPGQNDEILSELIDEPSVRKIVLYRQNVLANYSSALMASRTGRYGQTARKAADAPPRLKFDQERFLDFLKEFNGFYRRVLDQLNASRQFFLFVNYEETGNPLLLGGLMNFIGADPTRFSSGVGPQKRQVKQNPSNIVARFYNTGEVHRFLVRNDLMSWAHEGWTRFEAPGGGEPVEGG